MVLIEVQCPQHEEYIEFFREELDCQDIYKKLYFTNITRELYYYQGKTGQFCYEISSPNAINVRKTSTTTSNDSTYGRLKELYKEHNEKEKETIETLIDTIKRNKDYTLYSIIESRIRVAEKKIIYVIIGAFVLNWLNSRSGKCTKQHATLDEDRTKM
ncbi:hypothetical protein RIR_jg38442.t1 [Rhizophagus irregularis DAOM 181602=DAOM 197198]|nr:hypothetical protein RIR_jg38442.t1 [Rhizophagus irregularis DAOM 181602=DAOM 197198]